MTLYAEGLHGGAVDTLGVTVDGGTALTTIVVDRMWKIRQGIRGILQRGRCSGVVLEVILGHCTFAALVNRLMLSIFDDCYKFMKANYFTTTKLWPFVIEELAAFGDGIFLLEQSWTRQWNQLVGCGDASLTGYGICHSWWPKLEVASVGRISERSRFRRTQFHSARDAALISAGFAKVSGRWVPQGSDAGEERTLEAIGWEAVDNFPEVPASGLHSGLWKAKFWGSWKFSEDILILEARTLLLNLRRIVLTTFGHDLPQLLLCDNMAVVLSFDRCRSRNRKLLRIIREFGAYCLARNIYCRVRWIPSELNNADYASRLDDRAFHDKQLVEFVDDSWLRRAETRPTPRSWPEEGARHNSSQLGNMAWALGRRIWHRRE